MIDHSLPDFLNDEYRPAVIDGALHKRVGNEGVMWSPVWPTPHYLDEVAQLLVSIFDGVATREEIATELHDELDVDREIAEAQISRVIEGLAMKGLLPRSDPEFPTFSTPRSLLPSPDW